MSRSNIEKIGFVALVVVGAIVISAAHYSVSPAAGSGTANVLTAVSSSITTVTTSSAQSSSSVSVDTNVGAVAAPIPTPRQTAPAPIPAFVAASTTDFTEIGSALPPALPYEDALVADLSTGQAIMSANADNRWPMASITKLMNATIVLDTMSMSQEITITPEMMAVDPAEKTLHAGDTYTVEDLLHVMLMPSSNVAAEAFAESYSGGRAQFIALMNQRAAEWGMTNTFYGDPSGLSATNESTPDDLMKLAQKVYASYPEILAITDTPQITITDPITNKQVLVKSINQFAGQPNFIGGKTGYTDQADGNLLSIFNYENHPVLFVVLGTNDSARFTITQTLYNWFVGNYK